MRRLMASCVLAMFMIAGVARPARAQTDVDDGSMTVAPSSEGVFPFAVDFSQVIQQPAGPPPTPRHTGIKAMVKGFIVDFEYLPSRENAMWAGIGGGLALAVHPADDNVNRSLVGSTAADRFFKAGEVLGESPTLLSSAALVYALGRLKDQPKVSHVGMDLLESLGMSEVLTQTLKYATRRERPDLSGKNSFCLLYTSPSPRDRQKSRMPSSA